MDNPGANAMRWPCASRTAPARAAPAWCDVPRLGQASPLSFVPPARGWHRCPR
jgi:hypothetical protein